MEIEAKKIHRRYPENNWDYKAYSTLVENGTVNLIYYTVIDNLEFRSGVEVYKGPNYIPGATGKNYSRNYDLKNVPKKYMNVLAELMGLHIKSHWSKEERVNEN